VRLLVLAPIMPAKSGNGLAMRVASFVEAAKASYEPVVAVLPVSGSSPAGESSFDARLVASSDAGLLRRRTAELLADPSWRHLLAAVEPLPRAAQMAPPSLAKAVLEVVPLPEGTPVHVVRSYMAPLGLAVAEQLGSSFATLDLDDDDVAVAGSEKEHYARLISVFGPRFSAVALAQSEEAPKLRARYGLDAFELPNVVPVPPVARRANRAGNTIVLVGNLTYGPNLEAAVALVEEVLPLVRAELGDSIRILLVGSHDGSGAIEELAAKPGVTVTGFVPDLAAVYERADLVVAPIRHGSGTRIKLLEAFAAGVPVVTTPLGAAGLGVRDEDQVLLASTNRQLAVAAVSVLRDRALGARLADSAFSHVSSRYSPAVLENKVSEFLKRAAASASEARMNAAKHP
jgi:hypothetical protein